MTSESNDDAIRPEGSTARSLDAAARAGQSFAADAGGVLAQGASAARDGIDELPATVSDAMAAGEHLVITGRQRLDRGVRRQPVEALLLAGAIGYLLGWVTSRH